MEAKRLEHAASSAESIPPSPTNPVLYFPLSFTSIESFFFPQTSELVVEGFDTIRDNELTQEIAQSSRETMYRRLNDDLIEQIQLCARNQQIYAHMEGDNNATRAIEFQNLGQRSSHDLERLKLSSQNPSKKPIFHYEKRQMHLIQFNNDLTDNDLEVSMTKKHSIV